MILGYDEYSHKLSHTYYDINPRFSKIIIPNTLNVKFSTIKEREGGTKILTPLVTFLKLTQRGNTKTSHAQAELCHAPLHVQRDSDLYYSESSTVYT